MDISCAFATSLATPDHVVEAERLGYRRAWLYDSPALYPDVWAMLVEAAGRTERIGLGPGVLVPSLRHPMTNAAAIAMLEARAPGRVAVGIGSGFTGRLTLGQRPNKWTFVADYIRCVQALLRGEETEWEGGVLKMLHPEGYGAARPAKVPFIVGADGPKGRAVAEELGDGLFSPFPTAGFDWMTLLAFGTVLDEGEDPGSDRAVAAAGHAVAVFFHAFYERGQLDTIPGGDAWRQLIEKVPAPVRHLAIHEDHLIGVTDRDRPFVTGDFIKNFTFTGEPAEIRDRIAGAAAAGVTEIAYQPAGPDIPRELEAFAAAAGIS